MNASPWAVKKINSKCATKQLDVYQKRLNKEAKLLKGINHPNIVGKIWEYLNSATFAVLVEHRVCFLF